jgi:predicted phosphoribosyltransferase
MFRHREEAGFRLAARLRHRPWHRPLVLAIPRGGVVVGAVLARELGAELDVVLARKLRAPGTPECAVGAVAETGAIYWNHLPAEAAARWRDYLARESRHQVEELDRRRRLIRAVRPPAEVAGRSVIVADDGIATGSTMIAALTSLRARGPRELVVAVPVAAPERLEEVAGLCDEVVCLSAPEDFRAVGQFYEDFAPVEDEQVVALLRAFRPGRGGQGGRCQPAEATCSGAGREGEEP